MRLALLLWACTSAAPDAARESFSVTPQTCIYDLKAPVELAGSLPTYFTPGVDCVPPEGGDVFSVGFGWRGGVLRFAAPRPVGGAVSLYVRTTETWCVDWEGEAIVEDLPSWSLFLDGTCGSLRVLGRIALE